MFSVKEHHVGTLKANCGGKTKFLHIFYNTQIENLPGCAMIECNSSMGYLSCYDRIKFKINDFIFRVY